MKWNDLVKIEFDGWGLLVGLGPVIFFVIFLSVLGFVALYISKRGWKFWQRYDVVEGEIPISSLGKVKIRPNHDTMKIAYQAWIELSTRKASLPFDEEHDVLVEVYDSWYELFGRLRELAKGIPAYRLRHSMDTQNLVKIMIEVLNKGLRPHLTVWQAKFRKWYEGEKDKEENKELSPQQIQKRYSEYKVLIEDVQRVNKVILKYADWLRRIVEGDIQDSGF